MRFPVLSLLSVALVLSTAGCIRPYTQQPYDASPGYGEAINQNAAVMIGNPEPPKAQNTLINLEGNRALIAITRYQNDQTVPVQPLNTTGGASGGQ
jgi:hypothetical protein